MARTVAGSSGAEFVAGQHLDDHLVVGLVGVERFDDPVAPAPDVRLALADFGAVTVPVAVSPDIHPVPAPALAIMRAVEQPIDDLLVGVGRFVGQKSLHFGARRRQADQVEIDAPQQALAWPPGGWLTSPRRSCSAAMKASIGFWPHAGFSHTEAGPGPGVDMTSAAPDLRESFRRGPWRPGRSRHATWRSARASEARLREASVLTPSAPVTASISRLSSLLPGTIAGPPLPPLIASAAVSSRSSFFCFRPRDTNSSAAKGWA